jgi:superfamily II DNA or RNA helicase
LSTVQESASVSIAPGSVVIVRDEEWLVTGVEHTTDGRLLSCQGLSELVRDTTASFYEGLDPDLRVLDPAEATVVADESPHYRRSRLWLEATLRKIAVPLDGAALTVSVDMLADPLGYQQTAVRKALDQGNLRTRILLADAVGLGKTLEIGMILSELIRRGRGERILIVTPRHVLEQMQNEMWSRFAIPFVRLDSLGIQRVRQKLPATRNPFSYFKRVIISIDTLKSRQYLDHLRRQTWDAIVIADARISASVLGANTLARSLLSVPELVTLWDSSAERVRTLKWLQEHLQSDLAMTPEQVVILHGGLTDTDQQTVVDDFKQTSSPIRVLITGDLASEGVNLHAQCHELIHFDIPWSLIRIEQRNGRIDRYGQRHAPQITTLLLSPDADAFSGDLRVLSRLIEKEHEAHTALGDAASLMGKYDVEAEEDEIRKVLAGKASLDDVVKDTQRRVTGDGGPVEVAADSLATCLYSPQTLPVTSSSGSYGTPTRSVLPELLAMNDSGEFLNGHTPTRRTWRCPRCSPVTCGATM